MKLCFAMLSFVWFFSLALSFPSVSFAAKCETGFASLGTDEASLWSRSAPILLKADDVHSALNFSYDSEITFTDYWRVLFADKEIGPEAVEKFNLLFPEKPKSELLAAFHVSEKQFNRFVLRKGIDPSKETFHIADLNPSYIDEWMRKFYYSTGQIYTHFPTTSVNEHMREYLFPALKKLGLDTHGSMDGPSPELRHLSFQSSPQAYQSEIGVLHKIFPRAQTHFHLGLPANAISREAGLAIARATEAKIILGMLERWDDFTEGALKFSASSLVSDFRGGRGLIKYEVDAFANPVVSHDLEIRQWLNPRDGLDTVSLAASLSQNANKLKKVQIHGAYFYDPRFGNVVGLMEYLASIFEQEPHREILAKECREWCRKLANQMPGSDKPLSNDVLRELDHFLRSNGIYNEIRPSLFLKK